MTKKVTSRKILKSSEFQKLKLIGGHSIYHLEGNAFRHSILVWRESKKMFKGDHIMQITALLHDIGKIYTSVREGKHDWKYPNHAKAGGENLHKFIPENHPHFEEIKWYLENHIKPLFWRSLSDVEKVAKGMPAGCSIENLAALALCDIKGSYPAKEVSNDKLVKFLTGIIKRKSRA